MRNRPECGPEDFDRLSPGTTMPLRIAMIMHDAECAGIF